MRNASPAKRKLGLLFSRGKKSKPLIRIALLGNCGYSKNCGNIGGVKVKELRRFRKSEIRIRGGWSDVIKLVTSRCVFNGQNIARYFSNEASIDLADLAIPVELSREFFDSRIITSRNISAVGKRILGPMLPRFLQLLIKARFCVHRASSATISRLVISRRISSRAN